MVQRRVMDRAIHHAKVREKLPERAEPYWRQIKLGGYIGYRKTETGEFWIARWRGEDGARKQYRLGPLSALTYGDAVEKAEKEFFSKCERGFHGAFTVEDACKAYVDNRRMDKGEQTAVDADKRFVAAVYNHPIARMKLEDLRVRDVEAWRDWLVTEATTRNGDPRRMSRSSGNRYFKTLKAALNYAFRREMCTSDGSWRRVPLFADADQRRERYLTKPEREALISNCTPPGAALLRGLWYTAARPGELRKAKVADLDLRSRTLRLQDEKGGRRVREFPLTDPKNYEFFRKLSKNRLPMAPLFSNTDGAAFREHQISNEVKRVRRKLRLSDDVVAYTFRHCTITDWLSAGIPVADVAKAAGTSIEMISTHYHKFIPSNFGERLLAVDYF